MKKYIIKTYGCQMNIHESEKIAGTLEKLGFTETKIDEEASIIVFNTCCIRQTAENKILGHIGEVKNLKKNNKSLITIVCGCMSQQEGKAEDLKKKYPFIDIILGTNNLNKLEELILAKLNKNKSNILIDKDIVGLDEGLNPYRTSLDNNAWVNISYGCNNFCTYCIVPYVRGRERSRRPVDIVNECKKIIEEKKYKTITLLGQNVNSYGQDFVGENIDFKFLLNEVCKIEGDFEIKFLTSHPKDFTFELIDTIASQPKISKEIHLPVQSGNNRILKIMNRRYTVEHYKELIDYIKLKIPNARITTDIIVGFPSETEEEFMDTVNLIKYVKYDGIFAFMYSRRKGTVAYDMDNQIPLKVKKERVNYIINLEKEIIKQKKEEVNG